MSLAATTLYAPLLQCREYERIAYSFLPNADINTDRFIYYAHVLYFMAFISLAIAHGTRFLTSLLSPINEDKATSVQKHVSTFGLVVENLAYMGPAGLATLFFALFYVDQGTIRLVSLEWATLGGLFFVVSPSGAMLGGSSQIMFNNFIALLIWQMGEDSVRMAMLHKMAALFWGIGSTHAALHHKAKSIGYASLFVADVLLIVAEGETRHVPLPSYFRVWNTQYDPMWAPLILVWAVSLASIVPTAIEIVRKILHSIGKGGAKLGRLLGISHAYGQVPHKSAKRTATDEPEVELSSFE